MCCKSVITYVARGLFSLAARVVTKTVNADFRVDVAEFIFNQHVRLDAFSRRTYLGISILRN
jgi:hypothetical protein